MPSGSGKKARKSAGNRALVRVARPFGADGVTKLGQETLYRPRVEYRDGFAPRTFGSPDVEHGARRHNTMLIVNDAPTPYDGQLTFSVNS